MTPEQLLRVYDEEVRGSFARRLPQGWTGEQDGPLTRCRTGRGGFAMLTADASGVDLEDLVARTFAFYAREDRRFEWKTFDHDRPDLRPLLEQNGALPDEHETLVLGEAGPLATQPRLPDGLTLRAATERADLDRIAALESEVWSEDWSWLADDLEARLEDSIEVFLVEDGDVVVSAAWLVPLAGTRVAGLWGGGTRSAYRRRGVYRSLVAHRARRAVELGFPLLQVDASEDSRPILERLGLHSVGGAQGFVWTPR